MSVVLTCEHASAHIPGPYRSAFESHSAKRALQTHEGSDLGALELANQLSATLGTPLVGGKVSRLLVELNRSPNHPQYLSAYSSQLSDAQRARLFEVYYQPHRAAVVGAVREAINQQGQAFHIGVHSFTPQLNGTVRNADIGLLYDPKREAEKALCAKWLKLLQASAPQLRVRRNYPYRGNADGLTTSLRRIFSPKHYIGVELEVNQALLVGTAAARSGVTAAILDSLKRLLRA